MVNCQRVAEVDRAKQAGRKSSKPSSQVKGRSRRKLEFSACSPPELVSPSCLSHFSYYCTPRPPTFSEETPFAGCLLPLV